MDWHLLVAVDQMMVDKLGKLPLLLILSHYIQQQALFFLGLTSTEYPFREALQTSAKHTIDSFSIKIALILLSSKTLPPASHPSTKILANFLLNQHPTYPLFLRATMYPAARIQVILIIVMALSLVVTIQAVPATDTQTTNPSNTVEDTANHDGPFYNKTSIILFSGFFILADILIVVALCLLWLEGRDTRGAAQETRDTRETVEELELTDRLTWGRS